MIVCGTFAILFMAYGAQYSFGVFFSAILEEFGWSRASLSGAFSLYALVYSAFALVAGRLTDRWGPRIVIAVGGACLGIGWIAMSGVREIWHPYALYGTITAVGMSTAFVPCSATVARWFVRRRGLAVAGSGFQAGEEDLPVVRNRIGVLSVLLVERFDVSRVGLLEKIGRHGLRFRVLYRPYHRCAGG